MKETYLSEVTIFKDNTKNPIPMIDILLQLPFLNSKSNVQQMFTDLNNQFTNYKDNDGWTICSDQCFKILKPLLIQEIYSTAYILRNLSKNIINIDKNNPYIVSFIFKGIYENLTGIWENDKRYFDITFGPNTNSSETHQQIPARLIMAFGPSASGKTRTGSNIIKLLSKVDINFPKSFMTIDGGNYRENSYMYALIKEMLSQNNFNGFNNLVSANIFKKLQYGSLFDSDIVKKLLVNYLIQQKQLQQNNLQISLYIPETSGGCRTTSITSYNPCPSIIKKYIDITNDLLWSALLIWQHITGPLCTYPVGFKCKGCTESGKKREIEEGKKFSSDSWKFSYFQGLKDLLTAPGYRLNIHNSGGPDNQSVIQDYSTQKLLSLNNQLFNKNGTITIANDPISYSKYKITDEEFNGFVYTIK